jgi:drug/metabolite transporter (DMT)-like permease
MGELFAILAAASNGTIGVLSRYSFQQNADFIALSFWKCFLAWLLISLLLIRKSFRKDVFSLWQRRSQLLTLSFFGVLVLYLFETLAFSKIPIPVTSFLVFGSGIISIILGIVFLSESLNFSKILATVLIFGGIYFLMGHFDIGASDSQGAISALIGGAGYSLYIFLSRKFSIPGGFPFLWWFFGFGTLYLAGPFFYASGGLPNAGGWLNMALLVLIPTIVGYYFTSIAINRAEASKVQLIETSEPVFASVYSFFLFNETLSARESLGAGLVLVGLLVLSLPKILRKTRRIER